MKRWCSALCLAALLLFGAVPVQAQPEPVRLVEMVKKPGVDFRQFKSVGTEVSVSLQPANSWSIERGDPFLRQRIQTLALTAAKKQGWIPVDNADADLKLKLKIFEWGRLRNSNDQNLMEYVQFELRVESAQEGLVMRGTAKYNRVDPTEPDLSKVHEAFGSLLEEFLAALHGQ